MAPPNRDYLKEIMLGGYYGEKRNKKIVSMTKEEKRIAKDLLSKGWRNQDIQALINIGRKATINSGRITGVKQDEKQVAASDVDVELYRIRKNSFDYRTGLNQFDDERLVRARESTVLAVQVFNSASLRFKTEVFTMLVSVAWTYLLHEFYERKGVKIIGKDGRSLLLSQMIERNDSPISESIKNNLRAIKILRDKVEHLILGHSDLRWSPIFQACCLNFDKIICDLFGGRLTLASDLSLALQFAKPDIEQMSLLSKYNVPSHIAAIDAQIVEGMTEEDLRNLEFQFKVVYTLSTSSKSNAHFQFVNPESAEGKEIHHVLSKKVAADELYPCKPKMVVDLVRKKSGVTFTSSDHTKAWKLFKARPKSGSDKPENVNRKYCIYHQAHGDYAYSDEWVGRLVEEALTEEGLKAIKSVELK